MKPSTMIGGFFVPMDLHVSIGPGRKVRLILRFKDDNDARSPRRPHAPACARLPRRPRHQTAPKIASSSPVVTGTPE